MAGIEELLLAWNREGGLDSSGFSRRRDSDDRSLLGLSSSLLMLLLFQGVRGGREGFRRGCGRRDLLCCWERALLLIEPPGDLFFEEGLLPSCDCLPSRSVPWTTGISKRY